MSTLGIIFSNIHDNNMSELTSKRTVASIPFFGRYRLVDFALSNMVNSGITKVGIITKSNYQSLMDHVGSGKDWDLARHNGGLSILPPFGVKESTLYKYRLEALKNVTDYLSKSSEEDVLMSDSDMVCNIDFKPFMDLHQKSNADITMLYVKKNMSEIPSDYSVLKVGKNHQVEGITYGSKEERVNMYTNIILIDRMYLINLVSEAMQNGYKSLMKDVIEPNIGKRRIFAYEFKGYYEEMTSIQKYYVENMRFLKEEIRDEVFRHRNIYTKIKDSAPTKYGRNAVVENSVIADGCIIEGEVRNSIIFRGVKVAKSCKIENSIIMQNTITGENVTLNYVITDKNVIIRDGRKLSGCETLPFFISKSTVV